MGPMGPMMGGWFGGGAANWLGPALALSVLLLLVLVALSVWRDTGVPSARMAPRRPEDILRERYARGEIGWAAYRETLVNLLKDRYVRGELDVAEYEERLKHLLRQEPPRERAIDAGPPSRDLEQRLRDSEE